MGRVEKLTVMEKWKVFGKDQRTLSTQLMC